MEAELREGMQAWRKLHPKATLDEIETELNRQVTALRAASAGVDLLPAEGNELQRRCTGWRTRAGSEQTLLPFPAYVNIIGKCALFLDVKLCLALPLSALSCAQAQL